MHGLYRDKQGVWSYELLLSGRLDPGVYPSEASNQAQLGVL